MKGRAFISLALTFVVMLVFSLAAVVVSPTITLANEIAQVQNSQDNLTNILKDKKTKKAEQLPNIKCDAKKFQTIEGLVNRDKPSNSLALGEFYQDMGCNNLAEERYQKTIDLTKSSSLSSVNTLISAKGKLIEAQALSGKISIDEANKLLEKLRISSSFLIGIGLDCSYPCEGRGGWQVSEIDCNKCSLPQSSF